MKILFIGDICGRPARNSVIKLIPELSKNYQPDLIIANGENLSAGLGVTKKNYDEMTEAGIDLFTSGNHIWDKKEIIPYLDDKKIKIIRPENYPPGVPGRGFETFEVLGQKILILNLLGRIFLNVTLDDPFRTADQIIKKYPDHTIIIDFHAEATSEKYALFRYLDGRVAAIIGTHTHVQTNDPQISDAGTAFLSDVGMVGVFDSIIGAKKENIVEAFLKQVPFSLEVPIGETIFNAVLLDTDKDKRSNRIEILNFKNETIKKGGDNQ
jgi:hypothetical protein